MGFLDFFKNLFNWNFLGRPSALQIVPRDPKNDKILLVGINKYPGCPLRGCVNDIMNVKKYMITNYGVSDANFRVLLDEDAITANILDGLNWLVNVPPGARILFHYSGHGAQQPDEDNYLDDVICPVDFDWSLEKMITDKQFVKIFSKIPKGVIFNWISDSCHSGDLFRDITLGTPKTMPVPLAHAIKIDHSIKGYSHIKRAMMNGVLDVGFLSGCRSDQTSADTQMGGQPCGALTYFMLKQMNSNPKNIPLSNLAAVIRNDLIRYGFTQQPNANGARANKPFWGD